MFGRGFNFAFPRNLGGGYDADAQALFDAVEAEDGAYLPTYQKDATNAFIVGLKNASVDFYTDYLEEFFPLLGGNKAGAQHNLKLAYTNTYGANVKDIHIHSSGFDCTAEVNHYIDTNLNPVSASIDINDCGIGAVGEGRNGSTQQGCMIGAFSTTGGNKRFRLFATLLTNNFDGQIGGGSTNGATYNDLQNSSDYGRKCIIRRGAGIGDVELFNDGVEVDDNSTTNADGLPDANVYIGSQSTSAFLFDGFVRCGWVFKKAPTSAQMAEYDTLLKTWLIGMRRYVEPEFYEGFAAMSSNDNKFIEAYSLAFEESDMTPAILAKILTLQPLHKGVTDGVVNLVNPGTYNATLINSPAMQADGMKPNGATSYANTNLDAATDVPSKDITLGYYMGEDNGGVAGSLYLIGGFNTTSKYTFMRFTNNGDTLQFFHGNNGDGSIYTASSYTEFKGMITCQQEGTTKRIAIQNSVVLSETNNAGTTGSDVDLFVNCVSNAGTPQAYNSILCRLYYIADGLTNAERSIVDDYVERVMTKLGISAIDTSEAVSTEVATYFEELVADSSVEIGMQEARAKSKMIQELVNSGDWAESDVIQVYATIEQSDANLIHDLKAGTGFSLTRLALNSITRDIEGVEGNSVDMAIQTGYSQLNDKINLDTADANYSLLAINPPTASNAFLASSLGTGQFYFRRVNSTTTRSVVFNASPVVDSSSIVDSDYPVLMSAVVKDSSTLAIEKNGVEVESETRTLGSPTNNNLEICRYGAGAYYDPKVSFIQVGSNATNNANINTISRNYLLRLKGYEIPLSF